MDEGNEVFPQGGSAALVVIEFPSFRDFIDAYSAIISEEGIFIRNEDVAESNAFSVGDRVDFEVRLKDDFRLIQGAGEVVWLGNSEAAGGASGTAIRFHDVDEPSQRLISRLVGNYVSGGGKLFEVGGVAEEVTGDEPEPSVEPVESELPGLLDHQELTAETLKASEAESLFAADPEVEVATPLEVESLSVDDVETGESKPDAPEVSEAPSFNPDDPVGLETIAIPSGLVAKLASEAAQSQEASAELESDAADGGTDAESVDGADTADTADTAAAAATAATDNAPTEVEASIDKIDAADPDGLGVDVTAAEAQERFELPSLEDPVGADALLEAAKGAVSAAPDHFDVPLADDFDDASLAAAAGSMDDNLGVGGAFPGGIAEVAEELSGVHRIEMPDAEETSSVTYAGSASVRPDRNTGGRIAGLVVIAVLAGAAVFYFQDSIRGFLGIGGTEDGAMPELVQVGEAMPPSRVEEPVETASNEGEDGGLEPGDRGATGDASGEPVAQDPAQSETNRDSVDPAASAGPAASAAAATTPATDPAAATQKAATTPDRNSATRERAAPGASANRVASNERRVEQITWREEGDSTIVTIRLNAELSKAYLEVVKVRQGEPRDVIKIQGVNVPYSPSEVAIDSNQLIRLRTGLHRANGGSALHVVADLVDAGVTMVSLEPKGRDLEITFS